MKAHSINCKHYPYYNPSLASQPDGAGWKCRNRRVELFANITSLRAVSIQTEKRRKAVELIRALMHVDHVSTWESASSALFILNEPYHYSDKEIKALQAIGYEVRIVPTDLAPYGGNFDATPGAVPWTTSLLITKADNIEELVLIYQTMLAAALTAPAWNQ